MKDARQQALFETVLKGEKLKKERLIPARRMLFERVRAFEKEMDTLSGDPSQEQTAEVIKLIVACALLRRQWIKENDIIQSAGDYSAVEQQAKLSEEEWTCIIDTLGEFHADHWAEDHIFKKAWSYIVKIGLGNEVPNILEVGL